MRDLGVEGARGAGDQDGLMAGLFLEKLSDLTRGFVEVGCDRHMSLARPPGRETRRRDTTRSPLKPYPHPGDGDNDGLSRDPDDCNKGCIDGNPGGRPQEKEGGANRWGYCL